MAGATRVKQAAQYFWPALGFCCGAFLLSPNNGYAEPRALVEGDMPRELSRKISAVVEDVQDPPASALEARRRAAAVSENIAAVLRSEGYFDYELEVDINDGPPLRGVVRVNIGPRYHLALADPIIVADPVTPTSATLNEGLKTALNNVVDHAPEQASFGLPARGELILASEAAGLNFLRQSGYPDADAAPRQLIADHQTNILTAQFSYLSGSLARLGNVQLVGHTNTLPRWVARLQPWQEGDVYRPEALRDFEIRLMETGAYNGAIISLGAAEPGALKPVILQLTDRPDGLLETEASYATSEGPGARVTYTRFNQFGRGDQTRFRLQLAKIEQRAEAEIRLPHFERARQSLSINIAAFKDDTNAFRQTGIGGRVDLLRQLGERSGVERELSFWSVGLGVEINRNHEPSFLNPNTGIQRDYAAFSLRSAFAWDRTNNRLNPIEGYRIDGRFEPTVLTGDASLTFASSEIGASYYYPVNEHLGLALRGRLASLIGGKIPEIPAAQRLYAGGGGSVRGYGFQGIGPRYSDAAQTPVGGLSTAELSFEARYRFPDSRFGMVGFIDGGNLGQDSVPSLTDWRGGVGVGMRYYLDFAPIRFDVAFPLDHQVGGDKFQLYIGVGQSF